MSNRRRQRESPEGGNIPTNDARRVDPGGASVTVDLSHVIQQISQRHIGNDTDSTRAEYDGTSVLDEPPPVNRAVVVRRRERGTAPVPAPKQATAAHPVSEMRQTVLSLTPKEQTLQTLATRLPLSVIAASRRNDPETRRTALHHLATVLKDAQEKLIGEKPISYPNMAVLEGMFGDDPDMHELWLGWLRGGRSHEDIEEISGDALDDLIAFIDKHELELNPEEETVEEIIVGENDEAVPSTDSDDDTSSDGSSAPSTARAPSTEPDTPGSGEVYNDDTNDLHSEYYVDRDVVVDEDPEDPRYRMLQVRRTAARAHVENLIRQTARTVLETFNEIFDVPAIYAELDKLQELQDPDDADRADIARAILRRISRKFIRHWDRVSADPVARTSLVDWMRLLFPQDAPAGTRLISALEQYPQSAPNTTVTTRVLAMLNGFLNNLYNKIKNALQ